MTVYDDFAHHPTAIATTLMGLRKAVGSAPILAILEPRSNTMRMGVHTAQLATALQTADQIMLYKPDGIDWDMTAIVESLNGKAQQFNNTAAIIDAVVQQAAAGSHILVMSNGGFENIHQRLLDALSQH